MAKQHSYAANLEREGLGIAIYNPGPFVFDPVATNKCIGDIAYFDSLGSYHWIANAWDRKVPTTYVAAKTSAS